MTTLPSCPVTNSGKCNITKQCNKQKTHRNAKLDKYKIKLTVRLVDNTCKYTGKDPECMAGCRGEVIGNGFKALKVVWGSTVSSPSRAENLPSVKEWSH